MSYKLIILHCFINTCYSILFAIVCVSFPNASPNVTIFFFFFFTFFPYYVGSAQHVFYHSLLSPVNVQSIPLTRISSFTQSLPPSLLWYNYFCTKLRCNNSNMQEDYKSIISDHFSVLCFYHGFLKIWMLYRI